MLRRDEDARYEFQSAVAQVSFNLSPPNRNCDLYLTHHCCSFTNSLLITFPVLQIEAQVSAIYNLRRLAGQEGDHSMLSQSVQMTDPPGNYVNDTQGLRGRLTDMSVSISPAPQKSATLTIPSTLASCLMYP